MVTFIGLYFLISIIVAVPFIARYLIVTIREKNAMGGFLTHDTPSLNPLINHFEQKFLQRF